MPDAQIQTARADAADELVQLWVNTFKQAYADVHSSENILAYCNSVYTRDNAVQVLTSEDTVCRIAYRNAEPVGFYVVRHEQCPIGSDGTSAELKQIYVLASEFGTGLGKRLFNDACRVVHNAGRDRIWLCVSDINYRALAFYRKLGFCAIGNGPVLQIGTDPLASTILIRNATHSLN